MKKVLVTGGTAFVSRYIAEYYVGKRYDVSVLNRNTKKQSDGVRLIEADRYHLGDRLRDLHFDVVIDTGYTAKKWSCFWMHLEVMKIMFSSVPAQFIRTISRSRLRKKRCLLRIHTGENTVQTRSKQKQCCKREIRMHLL